MNALLRAEQAVLGAVLLDPRQLDHLDWLEADHFYRPVHQALFAAMRALRARGHPAASATDDVPLSWVTDVAEEAGRHVRGITGSYVHSLASACPHPRHAPVYGRMVLEGAMHRSVADHATRLHQVACDDALHGEVDATVRYTDLLGEVLSDLRARWNGDARPIDQSSDYPVALAGPDPPVPAQVAGDERFLLAVLVNRADAMDDVADWLRPGDFADPQHEQVYRCLGALHHRGEPIDQVTVLWEAQRRGLLAHGAEDWLADVCGAYGPGGAEWLGERVARASLVRTAARTARAIRTLARDETLPPGRLISHALRCLSAVDDVRARWRKATATPGTSAPAASVDAPSARARTALTRSGTWPSPSPLPPPPCGPVQRAPSRSPRV